jgi:hypothetical protein
MRFATPERGQRAFAELFLQWTQIVSTQGQIMGKIVQTGRVVVCPVNFSQAGGIGDDGMPQTLEPVVKIGEVLAIGQHGGRLGGGHCGETALMMDDHKSGREM